MRSRCASASGTSRDARYEGAGEDWPIDYKDIAPYYDTIEREVGVCGNLDGLEDLPDGVFLPPVAAEVQRRDPAARGAIARRER